MSNWSGKWMLNAATLGYADLKSPGPAAEFELKASVDAPGVYLVSPSSAMTTAWNGTVLLERGGAPGPELPWPLPATASDTDLEHASEYLAPLIKAAWTDPLKRFTCLEGDVSNGGVKNGIALFKVDAGFENGKAFLVVLKRAQLDRVSSPDGSAAGREK
jgi:hypothetical protein